MPTLADTAMSRPALEVDGAQQGGDDFCNEGRVFRLRELRQHARELVAAQAAHGVAGPHGILQSPGDFDQQRVARVVAPACRSRASSDL
jgi:hypothetical protein